ncbi:Ni/Fe-hydrogenase, b-type cytochrome subunit [Ferrimonas marina]|uniref:Ni/Fe-hydrogenase 1 B-type cytochrome subunit n=1 Tax=Ferrimonas marina TaxID=299255 RepID=A0A1M5VG46_9GAMM|nr:Ni/Fe-hydrogenase, b-type cytochrome subunit [Ferrimonas marina]SHH74219.1 Ni/Fe-hydrogenase 1 B-type cytochrome subunit [Ferrimonas marina]
MSDSPLYTRDKIFGPAIMWGHWLRAISIVVLVVTGFYIAWPFLTPYGGTDNLQQGWVRFAHLVAGFVLCAVTLYRAYLFFFSRSNIERRSYRDVISPRSWVINLKSYLWHGKLHKQGVYGPLQFVSYLMVSVVAALMCITGLILHANVYHEGLGGLIYPLAEWGTALFGGLAPVREIHHWLTWVFIIFLPIHVYMAMWSAVWFKSSMDTIVSGYDTHKVEEK